MLSGFLPPERPQNPTLLVGLGAFGAEVLALAAPDRGAAVDNLARIQVALVPDVPGIRIDLQDPDPIRPLLVEVKARLRLMLDLAHFIATTEPTDTRGPRCDVFVLADLGEPFVAETIARLASAFSAELRAEFQSILHRGDGALAICPLLSLPSSADRAKVGAAIRELARVAGDASPTRRSAAPIYLVEDRSGKYLLSRVEIVRSFAAFLRLLLLSRLRDAEAGVRRLVELPSEARASPFATFACATIEFDHEALGQLCAVRLGRDVLGVFRGSSSATIGEIAAEATPLVPERQRLEDELWKESSVGTLEKHLEPPTIEVPEIGWDDSPEDIVEHAFGALWRARIAQRISAFASDVERFKMDRLATEIEHSGKVAMARIEQTLAERVRSEVASGPRGYARALEVLRDAHTRAVGFHEEVAAEVESPNLTDFPASPLESKAQAVHEAAFARPRPFRMAVFGVVCGVLAGVLLGGVVMAAARLLFGDPRSFFDPRAPLPPFWPRLVGTPPAPLLIGAVLGGVSTWYRLWKHRRRHHNWVTEARDDLDQALKGYLGRDVVGYFYRRLHYTRLLWVQRLYKRLVERIEEAMAALEAVRGALAHADAGLARDERALDDRLETGTARAGILYRGLLSPADARAVYQDTKPTDVPPVAARFLERALASAPWTEAPFADPRRLLEFCQKELVPLATRSPFVADGSALHRAASEATRTFLRQLALKLSPPLELCEPPARGVRPATRSAVVSPEAKPLVEEMLADENLRGGWEVHALSGDGRRVHLLIERGELPLEALALASRPAVEGPPDPKARSS